MNRPRKQGDVERGLLRKGFEKSQTDHSKFAYYLMSGEKTLVWTKTSHGSSGSDISAGLVKMMAQQCHLSVDEFHRLIDCPLTRAEYEARVFPTLKH